MGTNLQQKSKRQKLSNVNIPDFIKKKHAVLKIDCNDDSSFKYAVNAALHPPKSHQELISSYPISTLNFGDLELPMQIEDVLKFEKLNPTISINIFGVENAEIIGPYHQTEQKKENHINLLMLENGKDTHYCWIKNISKLIVSQTNKVKHSIFVCDGCLSIFTKKDNLDKHQLQDCNHIKLKLPEVGKNIHKFVNIERQLKVPVCVYADFESLLMQNSFAQPDPSSSSTTNVENHEACSFGYFIKCNFDVTLNKLVVYRGENSAEKFVTMLCADLLEIFKNNLNKPVRMLKLTPEELDTYGNTQQCHICEEDFDVDEDENGKVKDHCHFTGKFRGAAHSKCNLAYRVPNFIPIYFHNYSCYDSHLFFKELNVIKGDIQVLAINKEKYISLTKKIETGFFTTKKESPIMLNLRFLDSYRFLPASLDNLATTISENGFKNLKSQFQNHKLLLRKGVYPYSYMDSWEKFKETQLPPREAFYNKLTSESISDNEYNHAQSVWQEYNIQNLGEYSDLYLKTDVLLLTDIFENFREVCLDVYKLDPCQYFTGPGLTYDAMLKYTKVKLELLTDFEMLHFFKNSIRGGLCQCSGRFAEANNKYMDTYDSTKESSYIQYWDMNNLYGWAMSQLLPQSEFEWVENVDDLKVLEISDENDIGYTLEVDLDYPQNLHDAHNDLPFCVENLVPPGSKVKKLITNLYSKKKYIIDYRALKQAMKAGLVLTKIHRALQYKQTRFMQKYIELNNNMRKNSKTSFEKDLFKMMNNAVYGKTMENLEKRVDVKIVTRWGKKAKSLGVGRWFAKPNYHSHEEIDGTDIIIIQMKKTKILYNKPIFLGFAILELAKTRMYDFHYEYMAKKYIPENFKLKYTDTDAFIYHIKTEDVFNDIKTDLEYMFDTSNFKRDNPYGIKLANEKVLGLMKDEVGGKIINKGIFLSSKLYSILLDDGKNILKAKGVKKSALNKMNPQDYEDVLNNETKIHGNMYVIRAKRHNLYTQIVNKVILSSHDDKRYLLKDGSHDTLAWGHFRIDELESESQ